MNLGTFLVSILIEYAAVHGVPRLACCRFRGHRVKLTPPAAEPAQIGRNLAKARVRDRLHLLSPQMVRFRKSVTQQHDGSCARRNCLDLQAVDGQLFFALCKRRLQSVGWIGWVERIERACAMAGSMSGSSRSVPTRVARHRAGGFGLRGRRIRPCGCSVRPARHGWPSSPASGRS